MNKDDFHKKLLASFKLEAEDTALVFDKLIALDNDMEILEDIEDNEDE